jgi:hypothetical protein
VKSSFLKKFPYINSFLALFFVLLGSNFGNSQSRTEQIKAYIEKYKGLALEQTAKFRIPASVILAQAIKESDFGNSSLARSTNNHFGIKCHKEWGGDNITFDDDSLNECFRSYATIEDSYLDHSMFLVSRPRYAFLFDYKINDHYRWCVGLKNAGYATAWNYTDELLLIIKVFHLDELDRAEYMNNSICYGELIAQPEKNIIEIDQETRENYFCLTEKATFVKAILGLLPLEEEPLLVRRNDPKHAD